MYHIGILQLTQNLDDAVAGFKAGLADAGVSASFQYVNADGNARRLPKLAAALAEAGPDLIFACATPSALAAAALPGAIPVVYTPVFDPVGAGLAASLKQPGGKATGVSGMTPAAAKLAFIRALLPAARKIGMLYHSGDANAALEAAHFRRAAAGQIGLAELPVAAAQELSLLEDMLPPHKIDALFLPIGRVVEENFPSVLYYADVLGLPIIASHGPNALSGALGALVANHHDLGRACAVQAKAILNGANAGDIPVGGVDRPEILLNERAAVQLGVTLPPQLIAQAAEIYR